jgi:2,4-dienoyl-CoA reductase-like NADH-dependent reductase (Old Yellow Enzyme family)
MVGKQRLGVRSPPLFSSTEEDRVRVVKAGWGNLIAFGRPFIANPDPPERIGHGWPLNPVDVTARV